MNKKNLASLIVNLVGIVCYVLATIFFVWTIIDAKIKSNNVAEGGTDLHGLVVIIVIIYGAIFFGITLIVNLVSMILALLAKPKKVSRVVLSIVFTILPIITFFALVLLCGLLF